MPVNTSVDLFGSPKAPGGFTEIHCFANPVNLEIGGYDPLIYVIAKQGIRYMEMNQLYPLLLLPKCPKLNAGYITYTCKAYISVTGVPILNVN